MQSASKRYKSLLLWFLISTSVFLSVLVANHYLQTTKAATEGRSMSGRAQIVNTGNFIHFNSDLYGADVQIGSPNGSGDRYLSGNAYSEDDGLISFSSISGSVSSDFDGYTPKFNDEVNVVKAQSDGKLIVGGEFTTYDNKAAVKIARLNADGTLDETFDAGTALTTTDGNYVQDVAIQSDGKIVVVGNFAALVNSVYSYDIVRLNSDGSLDSTFNTGSGLKGTGTILGWSVDIQSDGKIVVGGEFSLYNGASVNRLIRINTNGSRDTSFSMNHTFTDDVYAVKVLSTGKVLAGTGSNGMLIQFDSSGIKDTSFSPGFSYPVRDLVEQPDGKILVAGGTSSKKLVRLNADGSWDNTFDSGTSTNSMIYDIELLADGSMLIGGVFVSYNGTDTSKIAHINSDGTLDTSYQAGTYFGSDVNTICVSGSNTYVGGNFSSTSSVNSFLTRLSSTGIADSGFYESLIGFDNSIRDSADYNGRVLVGGNFTSYNGESANQVAILNSDGSRYSSFDVGTGADGGQIYSVAKQSDGKVLVGGSFVTFQGNDSPTMARLNVDGSYDSSFSVGTGVQYGPSAIRIQPDGKIIVGGNFTDINGTSINRIARLNSNGSIDSTFNVGTGFNDKVEDIAVLSSGDILVVGKFTTYQGASSSHIVRLNSDGSRDTAFSVGSGFVGGTNSLFSVQELPDGDILAAGSFDSYNGDGARDDIIRLNPDGTVDTSFTLSSVPTSGNFYDVKLLENGYILAVGTFLNAGSCSYAMKLSSSGTQQDCLGSPDSYPYRILENNNGVYITGFFDMMGTDVHKYIYEYSKYSTAYVDGDTGKLTGTGDILSGGTIDFNHASSTVAMDNTGLFTGDAYSSTIGMIDFDYEPVRILDLTGPTGSISINDGDTNTTSRDVTLTMTSSDAVSGVNNMIICEDNTFTGCTWETYSSSKNITLSETEGTKNIYMKLIDNAGNESEIFTDAIFMDTLPPTTPTDLAVTPTDYTDTDAFDFTWTASTDSGIGDVIYEYKTGASSGIYSTWQTTTQLNLNDIPSYLSGENTFYLRAKDSLENTTEQIEINFYYDGVDPITPTNIEVTSPTLSTVNSFSFSWDSSSDIGSGEVTYEYRLANTETWTPIVGTTVSNIEAYMEGDNVFYLRSVDSVGNVSEASSVTFTYSPEVEEEDVTPAPDTTEDTTDDPTPEETVEETPEQTGTGDATEETPTETTTQPTVREVTQEDTVVIDGQEVVVEELFTETTDQFELPEGVEQITEEDGIEVEATITGDTETVTTSTIVKGSAVYVKEVETLTISVPVSSITSSTSDIKGVTVEFGDITAEAIKDEQLDKYIAQIEIGEVKSTSTVVAKVITEYESGERLIKGMHFVVEANAIQTALIESRYIYGGLGFLLIIVLGYVTYKADKKNYEVSPR